MKYRVKKSGVTSEYASTYSPLGLLGAPVGALAAAFTPTRTAEEQERAGESGASNLLLPGVGAYNSFKRLGRSAANTPHGYSQVASEVMGGVPGALLGAAALPLGMSSGSEAGMQLGLGVNAATSIAPIIGTIAALATRRRTLKEQEAHDRDPLNMLKNLIPGVGLYNGFKRLGSTKAYDDKGELARLQDEAKQQRIRTKEGSSKENGMKIAGIEKAASAIEMVKAAGPIDWAHEKIDEIDPRALHSEAGRGVFTNATTAGGAGLGGLAGLLGHYAIADEDKRSLKDYLLSAAGGAAAGGLAGRYGIAPTLIDRARETDPYAGRAKAIIKQVNAERPLQTSLYAKTQRAPTAEDLTPKAKAQTAKDQAEAYRRTRESGWNAKPEQI